jgi:hypothetical protein
MLREVHAHVVTELQQSARTDTVFVVTAVLFNLIVLGINWGVASSAGDENAGPQTDFILVILILATLLVNFFAVRALLGGRDTRCKLLRGLIEMYRDNDVDKYYDPSLLDAYGGRYRLFVSVLGCLMLVAIVVPLVERFVS